MIVLRRIIFLVRNSLSERNDFIQISFPLICVKLIYFLDLSISDPLFLLPIMTSSTLALQLYLGADGINTATMPALMKKVRRSKGEK